MARTLLIYHLLLIAMSLVVNLSCFSSATILIDFFYLTHVYLLLAFKILSVEKNHSFISLSCAAKS